MLLTVTVMVLSAMPEPSASWVWLGRHASVLSANQFCGASFTSAMFVPPTVMVMVALVKSAGAGLKESDQSRKTIG